MPSYRTSLVAKMVNILPAVQETLVWSLGQEDPLEKEMATHSSILMWRIPWTEEPGGLQFHGIVKSWTWLSNFHRTFKLLCRCESESFSVMSDCLPSHGLKPTRLPFPYDFPSKNTRMGCHALLQGIFPTQVSNLCLLCPLHYRQILYPLSYLGSPLYGWNKFDYSWTLLRKLPLAVIHSSKQMINRKMAFMRLNKCF